MTLLSVEEVDSHAFSWACDFDVYLMKARRVGRLWGIWGRNNYLP